jgi:hypothetical protein
MAITEFRPENQNVSQAPTLGEQSGTFGAGLQQRKNIAQGGSGRFTNLQQYVQANEANNPNAGLLQREAQARQGELGTKQQQFVSQANPMVKTGLEAIRSGQQFVQSALQNPTQYATPERLQQFAGYREGGTGDIQSVYNQLNPLKSDLTTNQERLASELEAINQTPTALQNFIQSKRANPALATRGENVLDRFLTQSTQSGQQAIAGLGTTASAIRQAQIPTIASEVEALRTQAQGGPLSSADVRNLLTEKIAPEEEFVRNINNLYVAQNVGLGANLEPSRIQYSNNILQTPAIDYARPESLGTATQSNIDEAKTQYERYNQFVNQNKFLEQELIGNQSELKKAENKANAIDPYDINARIQNAEVQRDLRNNIKNLQQQREDLLNQSSGMDISRVPLYQQYLNQINKTRQEILSQYDPTRLSRIQALQQLSGSTPFTPLLQTRLT